MRLIVGQMIALTLVFAKNGYAYYIRFKAKLRLFLFVVCVRMRVCERGTFTSLAIILSFIVFFFFFLFFGFCSCFISHSLCPLSLRARNKRATFKAISLMNVL